MSARALRWLLSLGVHPGAASRGPAVLTIVRHHRVYADGERALYPLGVSASVFAGQLEVCARANLVPLTVREGLERLRRGLPGRAVAFTFDDGYADNVTRALPILQRFGARATFYLTAELMETRRAPWWDELAFLLEHATRPAARLEVAGGAIELDVATPAGRTAALRACLSHLRVPPAAMRAALDALRDRLAVTGEPPCDLAEWPLARRLVDAGMEVGAHTLTHPFLSLLPATAQRAEIAGSAEMIRARLGAEVVGFAYPNGDHDETTIAEAGAAGFAYAVTTRSGDCRAGARMLSLPRRPLTEGACTGPAGGFSAQMTRAELLGAFDGFRGRSDEAAT